MTILRREILQMARGQFQSQDSGKADVLSQCLACGALVWSGQDDSGGYCRCAVDPATGATHRPTQPSNV